MSDCPFCEFVGERSDEELWELFSCVHMRMQQRFPGSFTTLSPQQAEGMTVDEFRAMVAKHQAAMSTKQ